MDKNEFPRETNSLLTEEEKSFLDDAPDQVVSIIFEPEYQDFGYVLRTVKDEGAYEYEFLGERAVAVRDYYEMLFAFDIRHDVRLNEVSG
jgi:hypothetical protein